MAASSGALRGRLAVVTGAGSGIGRAVCQAFANEGARVAAVDVVSDKVHETIASLPESGSHRTFVADVSKAESVDALFEAVHKEFSQSPCALVNCAGITRDKLLVKMTEKDFDDVIGVNLKGTFLVTQAAGKRMIQDKISNGAIVNISSISGEFGNIGQSNYSASKAGVVGLTKTVAKELGRFGIRCNAVLPGFIDTPMVETVPAKVMEHVVSAMPLGRVGKPSEIADACLFLVSDRSSFVTGTSLMVTGGLVL